MLHSGGEWQTFFPPCDVIFKSENQLIKATSLIEALQAIKKVISACCSEYLKGSWKDSIKDAMTNWSHLHEKYRVSIPNKDHINKAHIIMAHVEDYIVMIGYSLSTVL